MIVRQAGIPMPDGIELAATLYLPDDVAAGPVPALLEYLPYRKDDAMLARDHDLYAYMARSGYAGARVDIRGTGRSGGILPGGEYTETEQRDAETVIAWLAGQPWCTGAVGMWGISWGGFNAIQVALRRPPALRAILAVDASDDLFHDDVHYIDGLPHLDEYMLMIDHLNMLPPAPDFPLDEAALARMDTEPWLISFLAQAQDGPFWRRASLRPDYGRLTVPAYLIGGWYDGYRDSVPRMLAHVPAPVRVLIGPWNHAFPHNAVPGPAIEWRADAVRWWDHWLKGAENGIMSEPPVTVYIRDWHPPSVELAEIPGRWRHEQALPPDRAELRTWFCGPEGSLSAEPPAAAVRSLRYVPSAGIAAGHWWGELTADQRDADAWSLTFDSGPLEADTEILGFPRVELCGNADAAPLHWFARLGDVAPDGTVTLVTGAGRAGAADPLRDADGPGLPEPPVAGRGGGTAAGPARHVLGVPARAPHPAVGVQRDVADDLAHAVPGHLGAAARPGRDAPGAARRPRGGTSTAGAAVPRARAGGESRGGPSLGRDPARALDGAPGRGGHGQRVLAGHVRVAVPVGPGRGRGVPALRGARRPARPGLRARRGPDRGPPGRPAAGHVVHPGPGRRRDLAALPVPPRAALRRPRRPGARVGSPLPPPRLVTRVPGGCGPAAVHDHGHYLTPGTCS